MRATLYEALGILPTSSDEEVRAARATDGLRFVRGGDHSIELRLLGEASEGKRSRGRGS